MASITIRNLAEAIRRRFRPLGGVDLRLPIREPMREPNVADYDACGVEVINPRKT